LPDGKIVNEMDECMAKNEVKGFKPQWIHVQVQDEDLWRHFEVMASDHQGGRSAFIRWLIDQEWMRRTKPFESLLIEDGKK